MKIRTNVIRILFLALFVFLLAVGKVRLWLVLYAVSLIAATLFGRLYCGYVCPMNTLMIPVEWFSTKFKIQTKKTPKWLKNGYFTWIALGFSIAVMLLSKKLLKQDLPVLPFWLAVSALVTLRYKPAVFHNLLCPFGAPLRAFGRFARLSVHVNKENCTGCKLCEKPCPSKAIAVSPEDKKASVNTARCLQCTECRQVCPKKTIHYGKMNINKLKTVAAATNKQ